MSNHDKCHIFLLVNSCPYFETPTLYKVTCPLPDTNSRSLDPIINSVMLNSSTNNDIPSDVDPSVNSSSSVSSKLAGLKCTVVVVFIPPLNSWPSIKTTVSALGERVNARWHHSRVGRVNMSVVCLSFTLAVNSNTGLVAGGKANTCI